MNVPAISDALAGEAGGFTERIDIGPNRGSSSRDPRSAIVLSSPTLMARPLGTNERALLGPWARESCPVADDYAERMDWSWETCEPVDLVHHDRSSASLA